MQNSDFVRSKIICTIGPSSEKPDVLESMIEAGMDVARINLSHGNYAKHEGVIEHLREINDTAILVDLPGPKIRVGELKDALSFRQGEKIHFTTWNVTGSKNEVPISYEKLPQELNVGGSIYINDGLIEFKVKEVDDDLKGFSAEAITGGEITSRKGINAPGATLSMRPPTEADKLGIKFGIEHEADWFAISFVRNRKDVEISKKTIVDAGGFQPVISKIEHGDAVKNIDEIIHSSDAIMVARGDLGIEVKTWEVPLLQKSIIEKCREQGKPVIVATQMLDSMVTHPRPTRAEASDVANAILDGADAVMLSEETALGLFPVESVQVMNSITQAVEESEPKKGFRYLGENPNVADLIGSLAAQATESIKPAAIIVVTRSGYSALMVSKHRPRSRILAVTKESKTLRRMQLYWGVESLRVPWTEDRDELILRSIRESIRRGFITVNDDVMLVSGSTMEAPGRTTTFQILQVSDVLYYANRRD